MINSRFSLGNKLAFSCLCSGITGLGGTFAWGQDQVAQNLQLEEILVTASKRETSLQDTSIAITAFTSERLAAAGIDSVNQLSGFVPNLVIGENNHNAFVMIRGIGTVDGTIMGDPSVAVNLDEVSATRAGSLNMLMYDIERVEVLRGPQGTLYGRNATGGSINILSTRPSYEFDAKVDVLAGDYDWTRARGMVNVPIVDNTLAARLSVIHEQRDGYQENIAPGGTESNDIDALAWRGQILWEPLENLSIVVKAESVENDDVGPSRERLNSPAGHFSNVWQGTTAAPEELNSVYKDTAESRDMSTDMLSLRMNWAISDGMELSFIAGQTEWEIGNVIDVDQEDPATAELAAFIRGATDSDTDSQELRLASTGDDPLQWIVGLYRMHEDSTQSIVLNFVPGIALTNGWAMDIDSQAIFGQVSYAFSDKLRGTLGVRYSEDEKSGDSTSALCLPFAPPFQLPFDTACPPEQAFSYDTFEEESEWDDTSWLVGLDWFISDDHMLYGKVSTAYKSGGFNLDSETPAAEVIYEPEEITSLEVGLKSTLLDGRMQLNSAAFYYDYTDLQLPRIQNFTIFTQNAAEATIQGIELEVIFQPADGWRINGGLGWLDATFDDYMAVDPVIVPRFGAPVALPETDYSGNDLTNSPEWTLNLGVEYNFELGGMGTLTPRVLARWQSDWYLRPFNLPEDKQDAYETVDIRLNWRSQDEHFYAEAFVTNVTDTLRATSVELSNGAFFGNVTPPRMWGVQVGYAY